MIYICNTVYHLLITLIKVKKEDNSVIILNFKDYKLFCIEEFKYNFNTDIIYLSANDFISFISNNLGKEIFIFNDCTEIGKILRKLKYKYNIIEDAYDYFTYNTQFSNMNIKNRIFMKIFKNNSCLGYSKYVKSIEVNNENKVFKDSRYKKMIEVPRKDLFKKISVDRKRMILDIFGVKPMNFLEGKKSIIILTQPLYQDNFDKEIINSEEDQIKYYKSILDSYKEEYIIYFKVHPRDKINYSILNYHNVIFLDKYVPMELYEFVGNYNFDIGITHSSTALDYLSCVKEKIFLKDLRK